MFKTELEFCHLMSTIDRELSLRAEKRERLRNLDLFVLDNSIRESTVGQIRGHTGKQVGHLGAGQKMWLQECDPVGFHSHAKSG